MRLLIIVMYITSMDISGAFGPSTCTIYWFIRAGTPVFSLGSNFGIAVCRLGLMRWTRCLVKVGKFGFLKLVLFGQALITAVMLALAFIGKIFLLFAISACGGLRTGICVPVLTAYNGWTARGTTTRLPYWANGLFYPGWNRLYRFTAY